MNDIFRFLMLRPPETGDAVEIAPSKDFGDALQAAANADNPKGAVKQAADALLNSGKGVDAVSDLALGPTVIELADALDAAVPADVAALSDAIKTAFGMTADKIVSGDKFAADRDAASDSLLAMKLLSRDGGVEAKTLERVLRTMFLIDQVAAKSTALDQAGAVSVILTRPLVVNLPKRRPRDEGPKEEPPREEPPREDPGRDRRDVLRGLAERLAHVKTSEIAAPKRDRRNVERFDVTPLEKLRVDAIESVVRRGPEGLRENVGQGMISALNVLAATSDEISRVDEPTPNLVLRADVAANLNDREKHELTHLKLDSLTEPLPTLLDRINTELIELETTVLRSDESATGLIGIMGGGIYEFPTAVVPLISPGFPSVPSTHGTIAPVGVGDLLVVRQQLKRYEGGELAHIENILLGEFKKREHRRARTTDETITVETETEKEEERDSQSTERFELQRESSTIVKDDSSLKVGLSVSGSYGPTVEFKASTDFAMNHAKEELSKAASSYSKEVTQRASSRVSERHREERILRTIEVFEETNEHGFDNTKGAATVVGPYQWVDKVYEAQVFNYGKRMMFDFMVPEPGAFWLHAVAASPKPGASLKPPTPFTLSPNQITPWNYPYYVNLYQVSGVKPPPREYITVSKTFEGAVPHDDVGTTKIAELPITDGYRAMTAHAICTGSHWDDRSSDWAAHIVVGQNYWRRESGTYVDEYFNLDGEVDSIPVAVRSYGLHHFIVTMEINCQRTDRELDRWRLDTHSAVLQAYLKLERDYREELAALEVEAANQIQGRNPIENRRLERAELKKQAISVLTAQHFDMFGAIVNSTQGYPEADLTEAEAEGRYIRFFEQAFEWEQMMYLFYPYFWGRKDNWIQRLLLQDVDSTFADFVRAGAARLVVPVRPGFETAIGHFLDSGEIWEGADPPALTSPLYVSIIQEIKERDQAPGVEVPQGNPWDVRLPTTLVRVRADGTLPEWQKNAAGEWLPV